MNKVLILGALGYKTNVLGGQSVKTRSVYELLLKHNCNIRYWDTLNVKKNPFLIFSLMYRLVWCDRLILMLASRGMSVLMPIIYSLSKIFKYKIIFICIGGWQVEYFEGKGIYPKKHNKELKICKDIYAFLPELHKVDDELKNQYDFKNTEFFPNFRSFNNINHLFRQTETLKLVFLARVHKKKGYDIIFKFAEFAEKNNMDVIIDFYGQFDDDNKEDFLQQIKCHKNTLYKGFVNPQDIYNTLRQYDILLFPTRYYTEGIPGTIIDSYIAGIPVIVTDWKHAHEIVIDNLTGYIISFDNPQDEFNNKILELYNDREKLLNMKKNALQESLKYSEEEAWSIISKYLD